MKKHKTQTEQIVEATNLMLQINGGKIGKNTRELQGSRGRFRASKTKEELP
jgi:hypothetical protein